MHGSSEKKVSEQQREKVIGDLLLVNRKEVLLFVIQRLFPSSEAKPFFTASFSESQFFSFYSNSLSVFPKPHFLHEWVFLLVNPDKNARISP
jgi:hypothetical protein